MIKKIEVRKAIKGDAEHIAENMRQGDKDEIMASSKADPLTALGMGFLYSKHCFTGTVDGEPVAMFGLTEVPHCERIANVWMLGTKKLDTIKISWLKISKGFIKDALEMYPFLYNFVAVNNHASVKLLKFLGATFSAPAPYGAEGKNFMYFHFALKEA